MRHFVTAGLCTMLALTSGIAFADDQEQYVKDAQEKLKATFQNLTVNDFKPSPVEGLFEINIGGRVVYFHPEAEVLIFGEIFSKHFGDDREDTVGLIWRFSRLSASIADLRGHCS